MTLVVLREWDKLWATEWSFRVDLLVLSLVGAVILFFLDAYGWHQVLKALGYDLSARRTIQVWLLSSLSRYVPGGVWSYASRVTLANAEGVTVAAASVSLYLETLLLMISSLAIGLIAVAYGVGISISPIVLIVSWVGLGLLLHPKAVALLKRLPGRMGDALRNVSFPGQRRTAGLFAYYLVFWILFGAVFLCFVSATHPVPYQDWVPVGASIALGFFVGFVVIFVPGGIGVRESILYLALLPFLPAPVSLVVSIGSRLWIMAAEGISVAAILIYGRLASGYTRP